MKGRGLGARGGKIQANSFLNRMQFELARVKEVFLNLRLRQIIDKHRSGFTHRRQRVLLDLRIRRQNALCETLNHCAWKREVLYDHLSLELSSHFLVELVELVRENASWRSKVKRETWQLYQFRIAIHI